MNLTSNFLVNTLLLCYFLSSATFSHTPEKVACKRFLNFALFCLVHNVSRRRQPLRYGEANALQSATGDLLASNNNVVLCSSFRLVCN